MGYTPHVLVVGGGATGTAITRDLAMRGLDVTLFEKDGLASGTTGRMHGLLHSGARYAETDPQSARECIAENEILKRIAGQFIDETGGLFVHHPEDPEGYLDEKASACTECGIPVERIDGEEARRQEPTLSDDVTGALTVPDAAVDVCRLVAATARSAEEHGASIDTGTSVGGFMQSDGAVTGVLSSRAGAGGIGGVFEADYIVNAAGAWAPNLAVKAGIDIPMQHSQGALAVVDTDSVDTIVNRSRPPTEGDIVVPHETHTVLGATDVEIDSPGSVEENDDEIELLREELETVVPGLSTADVVDSYWGVRPLYDPGADTGSTSVARGFELLDHEKRDGLWGLTTVVGGKFTTHRLMAETVADHVCEKFGIDRECQTAETPLPGGEDDSIDDEVLDRYDITPPMRDL